MESGKKDEARNSKKVPTVFSDYQSWYSRALRVVEQVLPDRLDEFREQYKLERRKEIDAVTYTISDYLLGIRAPIYGEEVFDAHQIFMSKFN